MKNAIAQSNVSVHSANEFWEYLEFLLILTKSFVDFLSFLVIMDIQVMLFVGFGFLMTFLRRFGYCAVTFTMLLTVMCVEYCVLISGFT